MTPCAYLTQLDCEGGANPSPGVLVSQPPSATQSRLPRVRPLDDVDTIELEPRGPGDIRQ